MCDLIRPAEMHQGGGDDQDKSISGLLDNTYVPANRAGALWDHGVARLRRSIGAALAGETAKTIAAAANSGQTVVLSLRFTILYSLILSLNQIESRPKLTGIWQVSTIDAEA
jgi:hypothetical protein